MLALRRDMGIATNEDQIMESYMEQGRNMKATLEAGLLHHEQQLQKSRNE